MPEKIFVADKATLDKALENTQKLLNHLVPTESPIYGMIVHEQDLNPSTRVEYIGANKDFTPMTMNMTTHVMNYGSWGNWEWLKANKPVMANWGGGIDYYLKEDDYTKKASDGSASDVANVNYAGNAMALVKKIYTHTYKVGYDRYVLWCNPDIGITPHIPTKILSRYFNRLPLINNIFKKSIGITNSYPHVVY